MNKEQFRNALKQLATDIELEVKYKASDQPIQIDRRKVERVVSRVKELSEDELLWK